MPDIRQKAFIQSSQLDTRRGFTTSAIHLFSAKVLSFACRRYNHCVATPMLPRAQLHERNLYFPESAVGSKLPSLQAVDIAIEISRPSVLYSASATSSLSATQFSTCKWKIVVHLNFNRKLSNRSNSLGVWSSMRKKRTSRNSCYFRRSGTAGYVQASPKIELSICFHIRATWKHPRVQIQTIWNGPVLMCILQGKGMIG
jgi:hypothetical protein